MGGGGRGSKALSGGCSYKKEERGVGSIVGTGGEGEGAGLVDFASSVGGKSGANVTGLVGRHMYLCVVMCNCIFIY